MSPEEKVCSKCSESRHRDEFPNEAKRKDGKYPWCKECLSKHRKDRYKKTPRKVWITQKVCSYCKQWQPRELFRKYAGNNLHYRCIKCEDKIQSDEENGLVECSSCKQTKPLKEYYKSRLSKTSRQCITCHRKYHGKPPTKLRQRDNSLRKYFGITLDQYKQLLKDQDYLCPVCLEPFEKDSYSYPVDHAHNGPHEGKIRAILHDVCNRFVMARHSDPEILRRAADLMENPLTDWFVPEDYVKSRKKKKRKKK